MITVTLEEHEAQALANVCDFTRIAFDNVGLCLPPEEDKVASAHLKLISALERQQQPDSFEALGVESNPHAQRTWDPRSC